MFLLLSSAHALGPVPAPLQRVQTHDETIQKVESMVWDQQVTSMASRYGLSVLNVTWEDTGRSKGSSWGPNISDMTIGVRDSGGALHPMPVFRFDNFTDTTADVASDKFWLRVGNERGDDLETITLESLLRETKSYLHDSGSWTGDQSALWNDRDEHVLVSAQACFLPIPASGEAQFTPVIYNYQSYPDHPAVLTIVASREGTSMQVIENESGYLSDVLFFNADGERAPFTAERLSDFNAKGGDALSGGPITEDDNANVVLVVQVPLKQEQITRGWMDELADSFGGVMSGAGDMAAPMAMEKSMEESDVEVAVIGHGEVEGPYKEIDGLDIERDTRFPVRVTVQFYKATSNGVVTDADVREIREQIDRVYEEGDYAGSLVVSGHTGRPTEWAVPSTAANWAAPTWSWMKSW